MDSITDQEPSGTAVSVEKTKRSAPISQRIEKHGRQKSTASNAT
jgi:hypothetical protein